MPEEPIKHYWLYALRLEQGKYYIGITSKKDPHERIQEHLNGFYTAQWVKKYKAIGLDHQIIDLGIITQKEAYEQENHRTTQYMKRYGFQNVRGGKFNYSGKYVKIGIWYGPRDDFLMILGVLGMMACMMGLFLRFY